MSLLLRNKLTKRPSVYILQLITHVEADNTSTTHKYFGKNNQTPSYPQSYFHGENNRLTGAVLFVRTVVCFALKVWMLNVSGNIWMFVLGENSSQLLVECAPHVLDS